MGFFSNVFLFRSAAAGSSSFGPWDRLYARRALVFALLAAIVALLLTAATDEGDVSLGLRVARTWPVLPVCAAVGTWAALASRRAQGERMALEALGQSPQRNAAGPLMVGIALSVLAGLLLGACERIDLQGYYPPAPSATSWDFITDGDDFVDPARGLRVKQDGSTIMQAPSGANPAKRAGARLTAAGVTAAAGIALTLLAACVRSSKVRAGAVVLCAVLPTLVLFHAASTSSTARWLGIVPALLLLAYAGARFSRYPGECERLDDG